MESNYMLSGSRRPSNELEHGSSSRTPQQVQHLEQFYEECRSPSITETKQLSDLLGLEPNEISLWFQNRRKAEEDSSEIVILREDNERLRLENSALKENLLQPNVELQLEHSEAINEAMLEMARGFADSLYGVTGTPRQEDLDPVRNLSMHNLRSRDFVLMMHETARRSTEELIKMVTSVDLLWLDSFIEGEAVLNLIIYKKKIASSYYFLHNDVCKESSKASCVVHMEGKELVDKMLDPKKRMTLFPFLLSDAHMAKVLMVGDSNTRSGYLQLVSEHVHAASPFIKLRWFNILRHCQKIGDGKWVIADISCDYFNTRSDVGPISHVKHPSGCIIQDLGTGYSEVTWVEHVEVDPRSMPPVPYLFYIQSGMAFGAKRWVCTLQTTVERNSNMISTYLNPAFEPVIVNPWLQSTNERRKILMQCNVMLRSFYSSMFKSGELRVIEYLARDQDEAQIAIRRNPVQGSLGFVICASAAFLIPVAANVLFDFLCDADKRSKWDSLSRDGARLLAKIPMGDLPGNDVSIIKPFRDASYVIIQEVSSNEMEKHISFVPYRASVGAMSTVITRSEHPRFGWLPSGFTIFNIDHPSIASTRGGQWPNGCILTAVFNFRFTGHYYRLDPNLISTDHVWPALQILTKCVAKIMSEVCGEQ